MKKVLIIGANGFVGRHLSKELKENGYICYGADVSSFDKEGNFDETYFIDILNENNIMFLLKDLQPNYIINLAAISSVKKSWDMANLTFNVNVNGTINILESIRKLKIKSRILLIGSSEQYGKIDYSKPVNEECKLNGINPYAISKAAQEKVALMYKEVYGVDVILVRAFNHIGPGQNTGFVVADFASQLVDIEKKGKESIINVGNLSAERDFTDVRDVVRAYRVLLEQGKSGEIYNVGSGKVVSINDILNKLIKLCNVAVKVEIDKNKIRKIETPKIICDNSKLIKDTNWNKKISLDESLNDIMEYWRNYLQ